jgi:aspartate/methionine/tyrosine aminotransferase
VESFIQTVLKVVRKAPVYRIVCKSFSKEFAMTDWRIGYVYANPEIIAKINDVHVYFTLVRSRHLLSRPSPFYQTLAEKKQSTISNLNLLNLKR